MGNASLRLAGGPRPGSKWRRGPPPLCPKFDPGEGRDPAVYRRWLRKIQLWRRRVIQYLPHNEAAILLYEAVEGDASKDLEFLSIDRINHRDGIDTILEQLRAGYDENPVLRKGYYLSLYENIKRAQGEPLRKFINRYLRYEGVYYMF